MNTKLKQSAVIASANIKSIPRRLWISASMILSIALVVVVLIGFLAMARGFESALESAGSDDVVVVLAGGARDEKGSEIPATILHQLSAAPAQTGLLQDGGQPVVSRELVVPVDAALQGSGDMQTLSLRGMDQAGVGLRKNVQLTSGRMMQPGMAELVVGQDIANRYVGFGLGETVSFGATQWTVVGIFDAGGSAFGSELWADLGAVQTLFKKEGNVQSLRVGLTGGTGIDPLKAYLAEATTVPVTVMTEKAYFSGQSRRVSQMIRLFGWPIAIVMAIGATAGALNTMLSSVSDRSVEIATLRAIGFSGFAAFIGTWIEALILTLIGGGIGLGIAMIVFSGFSTSTQGSGGQVAFDLTITADIVTQAGLLAMIIGLIGGAIPALKAARMPLLQAMRARS
jgi:putative ABC transport system permease protein